MAQCTAALGCHRSCCVNSALYILTHQSGCACRWQAVDLPFSMKGASGFPSGRATSPSVVNLEIAGGRLSAFAMIDRKLAVQ